MSPIPSSQELHSKFSIYLYMVLIIISLDFTLCSLGISISDSSLGISISDSSLYKQHSPPYLCAHSQRGRAIDRRSNEETSRAPNRPTNQPIPIPIHFLPSVCQKLLEEHWQEQPCSGESSLSLTRYVCFCPPPLRHHLSSIDTC